MIDFRHFTIAFAIAVTATSAMAQEHGGRSGGERPGHGEQGRQEQSGPGVLSLLPGDSVTEHSIDIPTGKLAYTATAGTFSLFDQSGERSAAVFYTAFVAKPNDPTRPVTFVFNGGPGAGSAFLNLGLVGPRLATFGNGYDGASVHLVDNPDTWLTFTDLEQAGQTRWRQRLLGRAPRCRIDGKGNRALRRQKQPRQLAEIYLGRKLRRIPRSQGGARVTEQSGHRGKRHPDGLADD